MTNAKVEAGKFWMCLWCGRKTFKAERSRIRHMRNCPNKVFGDSDGTGHRAFPLSILKPTRDCCPTCGHHISSDK